MITSKQTTIKVTKVTQKIGDFYIGTMKAKDLVAISYSDMRRIEARDVEKYLGIQRPLDKDRVKQIKEYLLSPDAAFPTGIVLAVEQNCAEFDEAGNLVLKEHTNSEFRTDSIPFDKVAKILDGQHRIGAFIDKYDKFDVDFYATFSEGFEFNVTIFIGLDIDEQANIFATINLAQTKVNKSLAYDLHGLSKTRSPFKTCHNIAVALDSGDINSPLFRRIKRLGVKTKGREEIEPLTQATFVESLIKLISPEPFIDRRIFLQRKTPPMIEGDELQKFPFRNLFLKGKDTDIAIILYNYFKAIADTWKEAWDGLNITGNILPRSNAFKAFMRFLRPVYLEIVGVNIGNIPEMADFKLRFEALGVSDNDFTSGNFKPGASGEADFYKLLTGKLKVQDLKEN